MTVSQGFMGMRGTGDWAANERPENWRQGILYRWPNGAAPLTAIMSKMASQKVDDPTFHWWTKVMPLQAGAVTGVYTDVNLSVAYTSGGVAGDTVYLKMAEALLKDFRAGHQVLMRDSSDLTVDVSGKVITRLANGASSYISVKLLEADDNSTTYDLSDCDRVMITGNINSEGAAMPDALAYNPTEWYNYTQIFRTSLEMSRTAMRTRLRTTDSQKEAKRESLELHSIEMEKALLFGVPSVGTGTNGMPERTTLGLIPAIRGGYTGHGGDAGTVADYPTATAYAGQTWLQGGEHWLDTNLEVLFRFGKMDKLAFCGSGAMLGITRLVKSLGMTTLTESTTSYGIRITTWRTPAGTINLMTHPLFSYETTMRNTMVIFEPENLKYRFIDDTTFIDDPLKMSKGWTRRDGVKEEWLTEMGMEYHHPVSWGYFTGIGTDNSL